MKIVITGGGTGGHFYPIIAVVDKIRDLINEKKMFQPDIFYLATDPYNEDILARKDIFFIKITAGKLHKNSSFKNFFNIFKTGWGTLITFFKMFKIMPDVVFTNGGFVAFPVLIAAKILRIPVIIHVSDTIPSRVLLFAKSFAVKISIAFPESAKYFDQKKIALLGNPLREEIKIPQAKGAKSFLNLKEDLPVIWVSGGSQGSQIINEIILEALPKLVEKYQIVHQTGKNNFDDIYGRSGVVLLNNKYKSRYKIYPYLDNLSIRMLAGISDIIIARAGAGTINEISSWGIPAILIPISEKVSRDQESNAFTYARSGAAVVIRQKNFSDNILISELNRIMTKKELKKQMSAAALAFFKPDAEKKIAAEILKILIEHESEINS